MKVQKFNDLVAKTDPPVFNTQNQNSILDSARHFKLDGTTTSVQMEQISDGEEDRDMKNLTPGPGAYFNPKVMSSFKVQTKPLSH